MKEQAWTIKRLLDWSNDYFQKKDIPHARLNSEWMLCEVIGGDRVSLYLNFDKVLTKDELSAFKNMIIRRAEGEPLQYILGHYEFMGLDIVLNNSVLIPRPETELLVEYIIEKYKKQKKSLSVLEIGSGSGCIPIALFKYLGEKVSYTGLEISENAIKLAKDNFALHNLPEDYQIINSDFLQPLPPEIESKKYDIILSNPPYVTREEWENSAIEVKDHEPLTALVPPGDDPLIFYRKIADKKSLLKAGGIVIVEISFTQKENIKAVFTDAGYSINILPDYSGKERVLIASL